MDSESLSKRKKQPGHDRSFIKSEELFAEVTRSVFHESLYETTLQPNDLSKIFSGGLAEKKYGLRPEMSVKCKRTGKRIYFEVKKQGPRGNAEERACKHHTNQFYKLMKERYSLPYHPFVTIFCEHLATEKRYTTKFPYLFEASNYFLWENYDEIELRRFLEYLKAEWLS